MNISLTKEMDEWVAEKVRSGLYKSSSEVVREGLRLLFQRDEQRAAMLEDLRNEVEIGIRQLDAGKSRSFDQKLVKRIKSESRNKLIQ